MTGPRALLSKLGHQLDSGDPWALLGLARLEGPEPSEVLISKRARSALSVLSMAEVGGRQEAEVVAAKLLGERFERAVLSCDAQLRGVTAEGKKLRVGKPLGRK
eukprot:6429662-Pyramimonas_sp.AAC.1